MWGRTIPELTAVIDEDQIIDRSTVNAWVDERIREAVKTPGASKLIDLARQFAAAIARDW